MKLTKENSGYIQTRYGKINKQDIIIQEIPCFPSKKLRFRLSALHDEEIDKQNSYLYLKNGKNKEKCLNKNIKNYDLEEIDYIYSKGSPHKITVPSKINPKLSYLIGYIYEDGGLKNIRRSYKTNGRFDHKIIIGDEFKLQIEPISKLMKEILNLN